MSRYLIDTNILARIVSPRDPLKPVAVAAVNALRRRNESLSITPQNLLEFWAVATRPREANGLGLTPEEVAQEVDRFSQNFPIVTEPPDIYRHWRRLAEAHAVRGRQVYDARIAAVMIGSGIQYILTFNVDDFRRYPDVAAVSPHSFALAGTPPPIGS